MKKITAVALALIMIFSATFAFAADVSESRVVMGANLTEEQRAQIYRDFGVEEGSVTELKVTNDEEREYLEGLVPDEKIGRKSLSCVYIEVKNDGSGLEIDTHNINWCTKNMYLNALITAGVDNASVKISAPWPVSGTAALTGIYKAYEDITGNELDELAKIIGAEELVITGELADVIGDADATTLVNELKKILVITKDMSDDEVREEIYAISQSINVSLTEQQIEKLLELVRSLEGLDDEELQKKVESVTGALKAADTAKKTMTKIGDAVKGFFAKVGDFFSSLFGG